jgi:hypothetical protein
MPLLLFNAYSQLLRFERYLVRRDFGSLYETVRQQAIGGAQLSAPSVEEICAAVDLASAWYWKHVLCLQRSAALTCLLRHYRRPAQMILGAQQSPFRAHAWVELDGRVVNDKPYLPEMYSVLDRC